MCIESPQLDCELLNSPVESAKRVGGVISGISPGSITVNGEWIGANAHT